MYSRCSFQWLQHNTLDRGLVRSELLYGLVQSILFDIACETEINTGINTRINSEIEEVEGSLGGDGDGKTDECGEKLQEECLSNYNELHMDEMHSKLKDVSVKEGDVLTELNVNQARNCGDGVNTEKIELTGDVVMEDIKEASDSRNKSYANVATKGHK
ncbi:hypothetical protein Tco_1212109 [Tanacetum coccineum]